MDIIDNLFLFLLNIKIKIKYSFSFSILTYQTHRYYYYLLYHCLNCPLIYIRIICKNKLIY